MAKKKKATFECGACGYQTSKWLGKCPECGAWNSFLEVPEESAIYHGQDLSVAAPQPISKIEKSEHPRYSSGIPEFDRVLGSGFVPGSLVLVGGEPGIGKSTMMLQVCEKLAHTGKRVLYFSGEESPSQIKMRGDRIGAVSDNLFISSEVTVAGILSLVEQHKPAMVIVDSIQTVFSEDISSAPGTVSQIREATTKFLFAAKRSGVAFIVIGHITKEGAIAGPKTLEHIVDTVLYFEGERFHARRIVRAVKNRFGSTNEIGIFEMTADGMVAVPNPSAVFISERAREAAGSAIICALEGTRAILLEVQALAADSNFGTPRRMAIGVDQNRLHLLLAIMEKRLDFAIQRDDVYVNITGGFAVSEPAADLGVCMAVASSFLNKPLGEKDVFIGEIGLAGEIRSVAQLEKRIREARAMGFERAIVPGGLRKNIRDLATKEFQIAEVATLKQAFDLIF
ncbi:MAG: DNA repair protein RadA [Acidobacteria bacterium]|nr:MAG: DNA repair protein RadA [Acidobacteriota bacterium]